MGRFTTLELADGAGNIPLHEEPRLAGEPIKDAQFYLDEADRDFFRDELEEALQGYSRAVGIDAGAAAAWCGAPGR